SSSYLDKWAYMGWTAVQAWGHDQDTRSSSCVCDRVPDLADLAPPRQHVGALLHAGRRLRPMAVSGMAHVASDRTARDRWRVRLMLHSVLTMAPFRLC